MAVLRCIIHAAMAVGLEVNQDGIAHLINPRPVEAKEFVLDHIQHNMEQISRALGKNIEYAQVLVHKIIHDVAWHGDKGVRLSWETKNDVITFENDFAKRFVQKRLNSLDQDMARLQQLFRDEENASNNALYTIIDENAGDPEDAMDFLSVQFWRPRPIVNIYALEHLVNGQAVLKKECPQLFRLLKQQLLLSDVALLPQVLEFQKIMVDTFDRKLDSTVLEKTLLEEFIQQHFAQDERVRQLLGVYMDLLDRRFKDVANNSTEANKAWESWKKQWKNGKLPCAILLPIPHGLGHFALGIVQLLVEAHNNAMLSFAGNNGIKLPDQDMRDIVDVGQLVHFDEAELNLMLLANYQHELNVNGKTIRSSIDKRALESMVTQR